MRSRLARHNLASLQTPGSPGVFFWGYVVMIHRYLFEVIFSVVTLCGLIAGWELFLAGSFQ
ncbi:hypothetical protein HW114_12975 [Serratia symbiotica]|uniref:hypothetical protein n=1 Tax=Serratia symbiotica TaxID=138074 RepID=UPI0004ABFA08|nr:hypothetical protein [Serratia symbiotica]MBF1996322.1 hypothetical protein [Serratia symbiotica]MBQ0957191.1 hypothetical protein [Serratia symbiotica]CDS58747.1 conserved hypothetical protein [Serratia symbiotica]